MAKADAEHLQRIHRSSPGGISSLLLAEVYPTRITSRLFSASPRPFADNFFARHSAPPTLPKRTSTGLRACDSVPDTGSARRSE